MNKPAGRARKPNRNPLSRFMYWFILAVLAFIGITSISGHDWLLSQSIVYLVLIIALFCAAWTICGIRIGRVSTVGSIGQVYTYTRKKEPVAFFILVTIYLGLSIFLAAFMAYGLLFT